MYIRLAFLALLFATNFARAEEEKLSICSWEYVGAGYSYDVLLRVLNKRTETGVKTLLCDEDEHICIEESFETNVFVIEVQNGLVMTIEYYASEKSGISSLHASREILPIICR
jgi:hypothetical protein